MTIAKTYSNVSLSNPFTDAIWSSTRDEEGDIWDVDAWTGELYGGPSPNVKEIIINVKKI